MNTFLNKWIFLLFLSLTITATRASADVIDEVAGLFRTGNAKELASYFSSSVEMTILSDENVYSRVQAEAAIRKFFTANPPSSAKIIHRLTSNPNYRFVVFILTTGKGSFRTSVSFKNSSGTFQITEVRIEENE